MINVLSLFDGMAGGLTAAKRAGLTVRNYYASEIDKYAMAVAKYNHPEIKHIGCIKKVSVRDLEKIDLVLAGPPCQGFSCCGSRLDFDDDRSKLFFNAIEILRKVQKINPDVKFLIENVSSMRKNVKENLSDIIGVQPIEVNSNLVSAQNRNRLYWTNLPNIGKPKDKGIYLGNIIESDVYDKYYLHKNRIFGKSTINRLVDSLRFPDGKAKSLFTEQGFSKIKNTCLVKITTAPKGKRSIKNLVDALKFDDEKSRALTSSGARNISGSNSTCLIVKSHSGKNPGEIKTIDEKTPTLSSSSRVDINHLFQMIRENGSRETFLKACNKLDAIFPACYTNYSFRRLTPVECERLQTMCDNSTKYGVFESGKTKHISNTQRYKMIGNGWTIDTIVNFLNQMENHGTT